MDRQTERQTTSTAVENNQTQGNADLDVTWLPVVLIRDRIFASPVEDWLQVLERLKMLIAGQGASECARVCAWENVCENSVRVCA